MGVVYCQVEQVFLENEAGHEIDSLEATCLRCGHRTENFGVTEASELRCLALMREECPTGKRNFYKRERDRRLT